MNRLNLKPWKLLSLAGLSATLIVGGCAGGDYGSDQAFFVAEQRGEYPAVFNAQARAGAKADAMLHPIHFAGTELNSLGAAKLELMLPDVEDSTPLVVYLNIAGDENEVSQRQAAVANYLLDSGLASNQFRLELGRNPGSWHPVQPTLARYPKTENPPLGGAGGGEEGQSVPVELPTGF
jgi:hypothetical protein